MQSFKTRNGQFVMLFNADDRQFYMNNYGKSANSFLPSPQWVMDLMDWPSQLFYYSRNPMDQTFWADNFAPPEKVVSKPYFLEIFTNSMGRLTDAEVRESAATMGFGNVDTHFATSTYNEKLDLDEKLYTEDLSLDELKERLDARDFNRLLDVHKLVADQIEAEPVYYDFQSVQAVNREVILIEGIEHTLSTDASRTSSVCITFPGRHALVRDVFQIQRLEIPSTTPDFGKPGRDRWFRMEGLAALPTYLYATALVFAGIQKAQLLEGRPVTMPLSPRLPQWLVDAGKAA